jgi:antitoxin ParD1/3/4
MTLNISLTPQLEAMVRQKVSGGLYNSASEVVREALRLMETQDRLQAIKLEQLRQDIQEGINSGEPTPWSAEEIKQEGRQRRADRINGNVTGV